MIDVRVQDGKAHHAAWRALAAELGASWEQGGRLEVRIGGYDLVLETERAHHARRGNPAFTRVRAAFINPRRLRFRLRRGELPSYFGYDLARQRLDPGDAGLEQEWDLYAGDTERLRAVLDNAELRTALNESPRLLVQVLDSEGLAAPSEGLELDVLECVVDQVVADVVSLRRMFAVVTCLLPALNANPTSAFEVPPSEVTGVFQKMLDELAGSLGGDAERVQDTVELRVPDPLGLVGPARAVVDLPQLPRMVSAMLTLEAPLLPGEERFTVDRRDGVHFWGTKLGDPLVDGALVVRGSPAVRPALLGPLRVMAETTPHVEVSADRIALRRSAVDTRRLPALLGAAFDLWQELNRRRAGEGSP
ncbi:MAG: hypothetical protein A2138_21480 [Deltaproteobacteria bacterium RBG_16_71_12]|nr:MAG: hypothetical protein A2138_21480 [Deltaproteobacteria bacterium RBG_16_71_12]